MRGGGGDSWGENAMGRSETNGSRSSRRWHFAGPIWEGSVSVANIYRVTQNSIIEDVVDSA